jgi:hypothetical protein
MDKTCKICGFIGNTNLFVMNRRICKKCYSDQQAEYRKNNKTKLTEHSKNYRYNNAENLAKNKKQYYETNKILILKNQQNYYLNNIETVKARNTKYRQKHKNKRNAREKERRETDSNYKLRVYLSRDIFRSVKSKNGLSTFDILPYSVLELREHLESQFDSWMNWQNHGKYNTKTWNDNDSSTWTWQIDHIIPRSKFDFINANDPNFFKCWSLDNLRPLSSKVNLISGSKLKRGLK